MEESRMGKFDFAKSIQKRTMNISVSVIRLTRNLPNNSEAYIIRNQILRSATSTAANYRAACRSRTRREFVAKLGTVIEEADETLFWLELITELTLLEEKVVESIHKETEEILAILITSRQTAKKSK